jgi:hypothetical protein
MASGLPPPPLRDNVGDFSWLDWYNKLYKYVATTGSFLWSNINFAGSNITDIQTRQHNSLQSFQGGQAGEYYHVNAAEYNKIHTQPWIEVADTSGTAMTLSTTPTLLKPPTTVSGSGISYDSSTGEFTFPYTGSYDLSLHVNATSSASNQLVYIYAETNTGSGWTVNANSGKQFELVNANTVQIVYPQSVHRTAGQKVRYKIYSNSNKVTLGTSTLPGGVGASVPAIRIQYAG